MGFVTHSILHKGLRVHEFCMASEDTTVTCPDCGAEIDVGNDPLKAGDDLDEETYAKWKTRRATTREMLKSSQGEERQ